MAKPGLISLALFNFLGHWNQYVLPLVIMQENDKKVLAQGLAQLVRSTGFRADQVAEAQCPRKPSACAQHRSRRSRR